MLFRSVALSYKIDGGITHPVSFDLTTGAFDDPTRPAWPQIEEAMALFDLTRREATVGQRARRDGRYQGAMGGIR